MLTKKISELWKEVFTESMGVDKIMLGGKIFTGYLCNDKNQCANGILGNDALAYMATIDDDIYQEHLLSLFVKPKESHLVYSLVKICKKTIKDVTDEKLLKRFNEIKQFVINNRENFIDNMYYNV